MHQGVASHQILGRLDKFKKSLIDKEGKSMTLCRGNPILFRPSQQLPWLCLRPLMAFWADTGPFTGPRLALCAASGTIKILSYCQVSHVRRVGPSTPSRTIDANLDCQMTHFVVPNIWRCHLPPLTTHLLCMGPQRRRRPDCLPYSRPK